MTLYLINGDCISELKIIDKKSVDLIIIDPPYLINYKTGHRKNKNHRFCKPIENDDNPAILKESFKLLFDVLKDGGAFYCFCNSNQVDFFKSEIEKSSNENDIVLDCFMGSGSTGIACKNLNRNFIGIELDKEFYDIAVNRVTKNDDI